MNTISGDWEKSPLSLRIESIVPKDTVLCTCTHNPEKHCIMITPLTGKQKDKTYMFIYTGESSKYPKGDFSAQIKFVRTTYPSLNNQF